MTLAAAQEAVPIMQSWAEGFGAVGTTAGFLIAALVYWRSQRDRRDDAYNQARLVFPTREDLPISGYSGSRGKLVVQRDVSFYVENHSSEPITDVIAFRIKRDGVWEDARPGEIGRVTETVASGGRALLIKVTLEPEDPAMSGLFDITQWDVEVEFTDANGRKWVRRGKEQPRRVRAKADRRWR